MALAARGGVASWRVLRRDDVSWDALDVARRAGRVLRLRRGIYALPDASGPVVSAIRLGGVLAGPSAARYHGFDLLAPPDLWIAVPRDWGHAALPGARVLRVDLSPGDVDGVATAAVRTVADCARRLPLRDSVVIADSALRRGVSVDALVAAADRAHGPGARRLREVVRRADGRAESPVETCVRLAVVGLGLPFDLQVIIPGVGRVDLLVAGWLVIECDGFAYHSGREPYRADRRRDAVLHSLGYTVLRFTYEDAVNRPEWVAWTIRAVLARGHARPAAGE